MTVMFEAINNNSKVSIDDSSVQYYLKEKRTITCYTPGGSLPSVPMSTTIKVRTWNSGWVKPIFAVADTYTYTGGASSSTTAPAFLSVQLFHAIENFSSGTLPDPTTFPDNVVVSKPSNSGTNVNYFRKSGAIGTGSWVAINDYTLTGDDYLNYAVITIFIQPTTSPTSSGSAVVNLYIFNAVDNSSVMPIGSGCGVELYNPSGNLVFTSSQNKIMNVSGYNPAYNYNWQSSSSLPYAVLNLGTVQVYNSSATYAITNSTSYFSNPNAGYYGSGFTWATGYVGYRVRGSTIEGQAANSAFPTSNPGGGSTYYSQGLVIDVTGL